MILKLLLKKQFEVKDILNVFSKSLTEYEKEVNAWEEYSVNLNDLTFSNKGVSDKNLYGVPFGAKDVINTINFKTQMGSTIWKNHKAGNNARIVSRLINSGALLVGKTVTSEFAVDAVNKTKNPWDLSKVPGTSSSGSAASVSSGMVPFSIGTQTLGSIIRPASWCGIYGMKPTYGLLPRTGILKTTDTLDTVGFFSRSSDDMLQLLNNTILKDQNHPIINDKLNLNGKNKLKFNIGFLTNKSTISDRFKSFLNDVSLLKNVSLQEVKLPEWYNESKNIRTFI